jgi:hypothetical protein
MQCIDDSSVPFAVYERRPNSKMNKHPSLVLYPPAFPHLGSIILSDMVLEDRTENSELDEIFESLFDCF